MSRLTSKTNISDDGPNPICLIYITALPLEIQMFQENI